MTGSKEDNKFEQVVQKMDPQSKLLRTWELKGGVSAQVTALESEIPCIRANSLTIIRE